jgi:murein DD-endopeptidase MepM/ murein hydrolase activator NlpD
LEISMRLKAATAILVIGAAAGGSGLLARTSHETGTARLAVAADAPQDAPAELVELFGAEPPKEMDSGLVEIALRLGDEDRLPAILERAGIGPDEARSADSALRTELPGGVPEETEVTVALRPIKGKAGYQLQWLRLQTSAKTELGVERAASGAFVASQAEIPGATTLQRFSGDVGGSLYWSLRRAGVPAEASEEFAALVAEQRAGGRFEAIVANGRRANGARAAPALLYAAWRGWDGAPVRRVRWIVGQEARWIDPAGASMQQSAVVAPLRGRVTSHFGGRAHPILRLFRFHKGVDIAAPHGTPVVAAADGRVVASGWNGGHGLQVRIVHAKGLETSYSHMSAISAHSGSLVRQGQPIGLVGSTGFSTGAHLHYEVRLRGRLVDPLRAGWSENRGLSVAERAQVQRHLAQLHARAQL